jgi:hypothetical protein
MNNLEEDMKYYKKYMKYKIKYLKLVEQLGGNNKVNFFFDWDQTLIPIHTGGKPNENSLNTEQKRNLKEFLLKLLNSNNNIFIVSRGIAKEIAIYLQEYIFDRIYTLTRIIEGAVDDSGYCYKLNYINGNHTNHLIIYGASFSDKNAPAKTSISGIPIYFDEIDFYKEDFTTGLGQLQLTDQTCKNISEEITKQSGHTLLSKLYTSNNGYDDIILNFCKKLNTNRSVGIKWAYIKSLFILHAMNETGDVKENHFFDDTKDNTELANYLFTTNKNMTNFIVHTAKRDNNKPNIEDFRNTMISTVNSLIINTEPVYSQQQSISKTYNECNLTTCTNDNEYLLSRFIVDKDKCISQLQFCKEKYEKNHDQKTRTGKFGHGTLFDRSANKKLKLAKKIVNSIDKEKGKDIKLVLFVALFIKNTDNLKTINTNSFINLIKHFEYNKYKSFITQIGLEKFLILVTQIGLEKFLILVTQIGLEKFGSIIHLIDSNKNNWYKLLDENSNVSKLYYFKAPGLCLYKQQTEYWIRGIKNENNVNKIKLINADNNDDKKLIDPRNDFFNNTVIFNCSKTQPPQNANINNSNA